MKIDIVPLVVAVLGAGGFGAFFREIVSVIVKVAGGVSARESKRAVDIVAQRDEALEKRDAADERRLASQEESARLRRLLIVNGIEPGPELTFEPTITKKQLAELREKEKP